MSTCPTDCPGCCDCDLYVALYEAVELLIGVDREDVAPLAEVTTAALPGTEAKILILIERADRRQQLHHPRDNRQLCPVLATGLTARPRGNDPIRAEESRRLRELGVEVRDRHRELLRAVDDGLSLDQVVEAYHVSSPTVLAAVRRMVAARDADGSATPSPVRTDTPLATADPVCLPALV